MKERLAFLWGRFAVFCGLKPYDITPQDLIPPFIVMTVMVVLRQSYLDDSLVFCYATLCFEFVFILIILAFGLSIAWVRIFAKILDEISSNGESMYLCGYPAWKFFESNFFSRLGHGYIGHGLCYEASALVMMLLRNSFQTQLVFGRCYSDHADKMVDHAWVEVKYLGIWWVIDSVWYALPIPTPRLVYRFTNAAIYDRVIPNKELWSKGVSRIFYEKLKNPETSYLLHNLVFFRRATEEDKGRAMMVMEQWEPFDDDFKEMGSRDYVTVPDAFSRTKLVTLRVINEYMADQTRMQPKKHTVRKAQWLMRQIEKARKEYEETTK